MMRHTSYLLTDIGGTHARFALLAGDEITKETKLKAADYSDFSVALAAYKKEHNLTENLPLAVATAAVPDESGIWQFHNENSWELDPNRLAAQGWPVALVVNDFVASARAIVALPDDKLIALRQGSPQEGRARAILGPGTGLGLAFTAPLAGGGWHVQPTHGGHMLATALTGEQQQILAAVRKITGKEIVVPEDIASGRGLPVLYQAICQSRGMAHEPFGPEELIDNNHLKEAADCWRLFHEFLGLFAHQAVITGHAYGGLYLFGGLASRLHEAGMFDLDSFLKFFEIPVAPSVYRELQDTPIILVNDPYTALNGLKELLRDATSLSDH